MSIRTAAVLTMIMWLTGTANAQTQTPITKTKSVSATATIQAIDSTNRTITLRDEKGEEDTFSVGRAVQRFDELKVGDTVKTTYYESVVLQVRKPGEKTLGTTGDAALTRGKGALPAATLAAQTTMTVTVKAIDPAVPSMTVTTPDGRTVTRKVEDKKNLERVNVGDQIDITYTRAILTEIEPVK